MSSPTHQAVPVEILDECKMVSGLGVQALRNKLSMMDKSYEAKGTPPNSAPKDGKPRAKRARKTT